MIELDQTTWNQIDPGIRDVLRVLHAADLPTEASCQGGEGHQGPMAWVVIPAMPETLDMRAGYAGAALLGAGYHGFSVLRRTNYQKGPQPWSQWPCQVEVEFWGACPRPRDENV